MNADSADFSYDPVTAIDEANATGDIAEIFADIRQVMDIPLVTSIWRGLVGVPDGLQTVWALTRPIYTSQCVDQVLAEVVSETSLPMPAPVSHDQLIKAMGTSDNLAAARAVVAAYNRSNGMNLIALTALITEPNGTEPNGEQINSVKPAVASWPELPALLAREQIALQTWQAVQRVNAFGAPNADSAVATLWRHLAHWPELLDLVAGAFTPLQTSGSIGRASHAMVDLTRSRAAPLASFRETNPVMPGPALTMISGYVNKPTQVARMVTIGAMLDRWLNADA